MRPFGFYNLLQGAAWIVGQWNAGAYWTVPGSGVHYADSDFQAIGAQVATPSPVLYPQSQVGLDFNAISNALLAVLGTASWIDPNSGARMQFQLATRRQRAATNQAIAVSPWLELLDPISETEASLPGLSTETIKYEVWVNLRQDPNLGPNNIPLTSLTACQRALRAALYVTYPINGVPGGYQQLPPGTTQTLGGLVEEARVEGTTMKNLPPDGSPMTMILNIVVKAGNSV